MREWMEAQLAAGLPALAGTSISGTVAVKQELLNDLLKDYLSATPAASPALPIDARSLLRYVTHAAIRAEHGQLLVDFQVTV